MSEIPTEIRAAFDDFLANEHLLYNAAISNFCRYAEMEKQGDMMIQRCSKLKEPIRLYLEVYSDEPDFITIAVPISVPGKLKTMVCCAGVTIRFLWELGYHEIGVAVTDSSDNGYIFKQTGIDDVICRKVTAVGQKQAS